MRKKLRYKNRNLAILFARYTTLFLKKIWCFVARKQKKQIMKKYKKVEKKDKKKTIKGEKKLFMSSSFVLYF